MTQPSTQVVVLGPHRSGTSSVAGLLARMGAYVGPREQDLPLHPMNPKGFAERQDVVALNDVLVRGDTESLWSTFRSDDVLPAVRAAFAEQVRAIATDLAKHPVSVLKDPRLCLTFPLWRPWLPHPVCVLVLRNPVEVARSLQARDHCALHVGLAVWEHHMREAVKGSAETSRILVCYSDLLAEPQTFGRRLCAELAQFDVAGLDPARAEGWIESELYHQRADWDTLEDFANPAQIALCRALRDGTALREGISSTLSPAAAAALDQHRDVQRAAVPHLRELDNLREQAARLQGTLNVYAGRDEELRHLDRAFRELLASWRWRLGDNTADILRAALLRPDVPQPKETILHILDSLARLPADGR